jgi:small nuclear ribonucleoprotein (snRNP)-like protein
MHQYSKFELDPYINRYVWIETRKGNRLQAYVQSVDDQFVELVIMEDNLNADG